MYSFINYVSVALEHESFLDNDSCRAIHFVATLNLHFGTNGLGGAPRFASSLDALQLSFCSICCVQGRNCNRECVFPKAHRAVCHSSAPQKELQGSPTAVCIPSVQRVALEMLERLFLLLLFQVCN